MDDTGENDPKCGWSSRQPDVLAFFLHLDFVSPNQPHFRRGYREISLVLAVQ